MDSLILRGTLIPYLCVSGIFLSIGIRVLGNPDVLYRNIGEITSPLPLRNVEDPIVSQIINKGVIIILLEIIQRLPCILSIIAYNIDLQLFIYQFPVADGLIN